MMQEKADSDGHKQEKAGNGSVAGRPGDGGVNW